ADFFSSVTDLSRSAQRFAIERKSDPGSRVPMILRDLAEKDETTARLPCEAAETVRNVAVVAENNCAGIELLGNRQVFAVLVLTAVVAVIHKEVDSARKRAERGYRISVNHLPKIRIPPLEQLPGVTADLGAVVVAGMAIRGIPHERGA